MSAVWPIRGGGSASRTRGKAGQRRRGGRGSWWRRRRLRRQARRSGRKTYTRRTARDGRSFTGWLCRSRSCASNPGPARGAKSNNATLLPATGRVSCSCRCSAGRACSPATDRSVIFPWVRRRGVHVRRSTPAPGRPAAASDQRHRRHAPRTLVCSRAPRHGWCRCTASLWAWQGRLWLADGTR